MKIEAHVWYEFVAEDSSIVSVDLFKESISEDESLVDFVQRVFDRSIREESHAPQDASILCDIRIGRGMAVIYTNGSSAEDCHRQFKELSGWARARFGR